MIKLFILRHAIAVERGTPGYKDDSKRPLTDKGKEKMYQNAAGLKTFGISFDLILSSPYQRAKQTAYIVVDVLKIRKHCLVFTNNLIPDVTYEKLIREINTFSKKHQNILLVGHEPHLSGLISYLLTGQRNMSINFKKGGICCLTIAKLCLAGSASLEWLLSPAQLSQLS